MKIHERTTRKKKKKKRSKQSRGEGTKSASRMSHRTSPFKHNPVNTQERKKAHEVYFFFF